MEQLYSLFEIARLIANESCGFITDSERMVLQEWLDKSIKNKQLYEKIKNGNLIQKDFETIEKFNDNKAYKKVLKIISAEETKPGKIRLVPNFIKYAAAVAILLISSFFVIYFVKQTRQTLPVQYAAFTPGEQKAVLITANQKQIQLDSMAGKHIIQDESIEIVQSGSTLSYQTAENTATEPIYNTLFTQQGGEYSIILSDGTEVLLNACSKLRYPVHFNDVARVVELEGEALFKVTKLQKTPFIVKTNALDITVYGTMFNVLAYGDENLIQTTLVEGSVGIGILNDNNTSEVKIKPGQQNIYDKAKGIIKTKDVDVAQYLAWSKGLFIFENEPVENILRTMSRWYSFNYKFNDSRLKDQRFTLSLGRYDNASKIFELMTASSNLKFISENNTILVYSK